MKANTIKKVFDWVLVGLIALSGVGYAIGNVWYELDEGSLWFIYNSTILPSTFAMFISFIAFTMRDEIHEWFDEKFKDKEMITFQL